ncbi:transcriptional regulator [Actinoalloteichus sp. GBA129-24]|nr:transcriptional regulator [Actinoalloteichus sp. GBA129-24]
MLVLCRAGRPPFQASARRRVLPFPTAAVAGECRIKGQERTVTSLSERVAGRIRRDIIRGTLAPGTRVTEAALSEAYGVSRVPIREAFRVLETEGFVVSRPYAGSTVAALDTADADDLFAVRATVEERTARRAAGRADSAAVARLMAVVDAGDSALAAGRRQDLTDLNTAFHLAIAEIAANPSLTGMLRQLAGKIEWIYAADVAVRAESSWIEHRLIASAIETGDVDGAALLMRRHVENSRHGYLLRHG